MSNNKKAFGWIGHMLMNAEADRGDPSENIISIPNELFAQIAANHGDGNLPKGVRAETLGIEAIWAEGEFSPFLAVGHSFSEGYGCYGAEFKEATASIRRGSLLYRTDRAYLKAMLDSYGLELPPSKPMIGCSSEHP